MKKDFIIAASIIILMLVLLQQRCGYQNKLNEQTALINNLSDTLRIKTNKNNEESSRTAVLKTNNVSDFLSIKSRDSAIVKLQLEVKKYKGELKNGGSVTNINSTTNVNASGQTVVIHDTTFVLDSLIVKPVYKTELNNKWYRGEITAKEDSIHLDIQIENEYTIVLGQERIGLLKRKPFVEVTNKNPYTNTKTLKTYEVNNTMKTKRIGVGAIIGYGIGSDLKLTPIVGIGLSYNLISF